MSMATQAQLIVVEDVLASRGIACVDRAIVFE
ncbi:uncharacterized protein FTOL_13961 [Fusarium torulosum]|uniref:Uncharacterized protein n=1 Tax=Fusarium torulosum TaxID=33205 RepID=A0AAE8MNE8_9HYPO|nr:uncharacterized protein FTOL_13961 [Fusarium torulosum]